MRSFLPFGFVKLFNTVHLFGYLIICISLNDINELYADDATNSRNDQSSISSGKIPSITVLKYQNLSKEVNSETENNIQTMIQSTLRSKGYSVTISESYFSDLSRNSTVSNLDSDLIILGFYEKKSKDENINLYSQIIRTSDGKVIDAFNITDEVFEIMKDSLNKQDILEPDEDRISRMVDKLLNQVRLNHELKPKYYNIDEYILSTEKMRTKNLPLEAGDESAKMEVFDLMKNQVTKSSTKFAKKTNEAPNIVSVISAEEIEDYGRISLNDILYQIPGFAPSRDYDRRTVTGRGMFEGWNNNHLLLLVDGVQFNDNLYGSAYTWEITPLNMIKSVEVIRGPGSALYGSNATNGVVSINTWSGKDLQGEVRVRTRVGEAETQIYDVLTGGVSDYFSYVASYNSFSTNGNDQVSTDDSGRVDDFGFLQKFAIPDRRKNSTVFLKLEGEDFLEGFSVQYHRNQWQFETGHGWLWRVPDFQENMQEGRQIVMTKYSGNITTKLSQEYVLLYQERSIDWKIRFAERGAYEDFYPEGNWEILNTNANNIFGRSQLAYDLGGGGNVLVGMEANVFRYKNDRKHLSDVDYSNAEDEFPPYENGFNPQGPWLEWIAGEPVPSFAAYAQLVSGRFWNKSLELTLGVRYDETYAKYMAIDEPFGRIVDEVPFTPMERRVFRRTSPRAGLVYFATDKLSFKAMGGTAFRAPSITEMFGANTFTLASNPRELKPEIITTYDFGMDWIFWKYFNFRANWFWTKFENQIAYSIQNNNLSTNIYDLVTRGVESELLITYKKFSGFINYSWNQRMNEKIYDETVAESPRETTWAPARTANLGIRQHFYRWMYSISVQYQGRVKRRISDQDVYDPETGSLENPFYQYNYPRYRPDSIDPWVQLNWKTAYYFTDKMSLGLFVSNALNQEQYLIKNNLYPFDYRRENRRFLVDFSASF